MEAMTVDGPGQRDRRIRKFLMERESNPRYIEETGDLDAQNGEGYARMLPAPVETRPEERPSRSRHDEADMYDHENRGHR